MDISFLLSTRLDTPDNKTGVPYTPCSLSPTNDELHTALDIFCFGVSLLIEVIEVDELEVVTVSI